MNCVDCGKEGMYWHGDGKPGVNEGDVILCSDDVTRREQLKEGYYAI